MDEVEHQKLDICRVCLLPSAEIVPLDAPLDAVSETDNHTSVMHALETVMYVKVRQAANYPNQLCLRCEKDLSISYSFHLLFHRSQYLLEQFMKESVLEETSNEGEIETLKKSVKLTADSPCWDDVVIVVKKENTVDSGENISEGVVAKLEKSPSSDLEEIKVIVLNEPQTQNIDAIESEAGGETSEISHLSEPAPKCDQQNMIDNQVKSGCEETIRRGENDYEMVKLEPHIICGGMAADSDGDDMNEMDYSFEDEPGDSNEFEGERTVAFKESLELDETIRVTKKVVRTPKEKLFVCESCGETAVTQNPFKKNIICKNCHIKMLKRCPKCDYTTHVSNKLYAHKVRHLGPQFKCNICDKAYLSKAGLDKHKDKHDNIQNYLCTVCGKTFGHESGLLYHMRNHNNDRKFCCAFCGEKFISNGHLKRHEITHAGTRPHPCSLCEKSFYTVAAKKRHEMSVHEGYRPFECKYCKKGFQTKYHVKVHYMSHTGAYFCEFCSKSFIESEFLQIHLNDKHKNDEDQFAVAT